MKLLYHVTTPDRVDMIKTVGLQPKVEKRGIYAVNRNPGIYLFSDLVTADDALTNWLADQMRGHTQAVAFAVDVTGLKLEADPELAGSFVTQQPIGPERLSVAKVFDLGPEDEDAGGGAL